MKQPTHFFDPALEALYTRQLPDSSLSWSDNEANLQYLFYQLNQSGQKHVVMPRAYSFIQQQLNQVQQALAVPLIQNYTVSNLAFLQAEILTPITRQLDTESNLSLWIRQTSSILLTQPCWLQNICSSASSQTQTALQCISLYLQLTGKDQHSIDLQQSYLGLLQASGHEIPKLHRYSYCQQNDLPTEIVTFATLQLALSLFPRVLLPEILGFTLAYCQMPSIIESCFPNPQLPGNFLQQRQQRLAQQIEPLQQCIADYLNLFPQHTQKLWRRIQIGFWLYQKKVQHSQEQFTESLDCSFKAHQDFANLIQQKSMAAIGHHQKIQLQGISLDLWFAGLPNNTQEFLHALIHSGYVDKQNPGNSRLLKLFDFKGPMFGVLNPSEREVLLNWLQTELQLPALDISTNSTPSNQVFVPEKKLTHNNYAHKSTRQLYYYLVNADLFPDALPIARTKVSRLLNTCALVNPLPFKHYSHQKLDTYIENIYQYEVHTYQPLQGKPKISREAYIWGFEQITPMVLIDGCWIQNGLALEQVNPEISAILYRIYCDEIGEGKLEQNHPFIFQQLLDSLSIHLPPAYSKEFIDHPGFINSAFDLPVFMLSLSSFSVEFLPELLGLNLAIELSGLGKSYMRLVDDWNYWGINPSIASIHISIDNYASGHAYLAKKAIQLYMDDLLQLTTKHHILDSHWRRIYTGYASLRFVGARFKFGLPVHYLAFKYRHSIIKKWNQTITM